MTSVNNVRRDLNHIFDSWSSDIPLVTECRKLLNEVISTWSTNLIEILKEIVKFLFQDNVSLFVSRQVFSDLCLQILPGLPDPQSKLLAHFMREEMQQRETNFEYHLSIVCHHLSYIYEKEENWKEAANLLASISLESYYRFSIDYELELYMKIARLYMEDDDPLLAEPYVKKASILQIESTNTDLHLSYKVCYARMLDFRLKFIEAAQEYYELSNCSLVKENERLTALKNTLVCTILSFAGDIRTQMLKSLCNDERCQVWIKLSTLKKLWLVHIIKPSEIDQIETLLLPHQKAKTNDGTTIFIEAIAEHNIQSIQKIYKNIKIESLGYFLGLEPHKAELIAKRMISEGRIDGSIDQSNGFITFKTQNEKMKQWREKIESLNTQFNRINKLISENFSAQKVKNDHTDV